MAKKQTPLKVYGLIGQRLDYSFSRSFFQEKFDREGLDNCTYRNFEITDKAELLRFRESETKRLDSHGQSICGLNVTIPYKQAVMEIVDDLDPVAEEIGAVNTIVIKNGRWTGHNTDAHGFTLSLKDHLPLQKNALILGTGGASLAVSYALGALGIGHLFVSRDPDGDHQIGYPSINKDVLAQVSLIVNCTPLGTHPATDTAPALPYEAMTGGHLLYDLVYNPKNTLFMKKGKQHGASAVNGYRMLVEQAKKAWELWQS